MGITEQYAHKDGYDVQQNSSLFSRHLLCSYMPFLHQTTVLPCFCEFMFLYVSIQNFYENAQTSSYSPATAIVSEIKHCPTAILLQSIRRIASPRTMHGRKLPSIVRERFREDAQNGLRPEHRQHLQVGGTWSGFWVCVFFGLHIIFPLTPSNGELANQNLGAGLKVES